MQQPPGGWGPPHGGYGPPPPYGHPSQPQIVVVHAAPQAYVCPFCQRPCMPRSASTMSGGGLVLMIVLLVLCVTAPFFWLAFFITEERWYCNLCNSRLMR